MIILCMRYDKFEVRNMIRVLSFYKNIYMIQIALAWRDKYFEVIEVILIMPNKSINTRIG